MGRVALISACIGRAQLCYAGFRPERFGYFTDRFVPSPSPVWPLK